MSVPVQDLVLLGLLRERSLHGYEIMQIVKEQMSQVAEIAPGTIYYTLKKLEKKAFIESRMEREGNRPERQVYAITKEGKARFDELLKEALFLDERPFYVFDAALYFFQHLKEDDLSDAVEKKRENLARFKQNLDRLESAYPGKWPFHLEMLKEKAYLHSEALDTWYRKLRDGLKRRRRRRNANSQ
jgi:DNA-binding PadR family transcriptional regulator